MPGKLGAGFLGVSYCLFTLISGVVAAESQRYLVKVKGNSSTVLALSARNSRLSSLSAEIRSEVPGLKTLESYQRVNLLVVEGEKALLESALKRNPSVLYYEKEISWKPLFSDSELPSSQSKSPWLKDVMGLDADEPDPEIEFNGSPPVIVAVVDTGLNIEHPFIGSALAKNNRESSADPGVDHDGNGYDNDVYGANVYSRDGDIAESNSNHGTHVAGLVKVVRDQAIEKYAQAAAVQLMPVKFIDSTGSGSTAGAIAALEYAAARGARVVNASWGSTGAASYSQALYDAMMSLYQQNIFIAVAAGNSQYGNNNDLNPTFPASFNIPGIMSVASITPIYELRSGEAELSKIRLSSFSHFGVNTVHVAAPGDYQAADFSEDGLLSANADYQEDGEEFIKMRGTSMASPIVAGVAAVMRAINPSLTSYEVKKLILDKAKKNSQLSQIQSSAYVDAAASFKAAETAVSQGLQPGSASPGAPPNGASAGGRRGFAGCGLLQSPEDEFRGPMSGNSLGFFSMLYFYWLLIRKLKGQVRSAGV